MTFTPLHLIKSYYLLGSNYSAGDSLYINTSERSQVLTGLQLLRHQAKNKIGEFDTPEGSRGSHVFYTAIILPGGTKVSRVVKCFNQLSLPCGQHGFLVPGKLTDLKKKPIT